jgi:hypothetical protein
MTDLAVDVPQHVDGLEPRIVPLGVLAVVSEREVAMGSLQVVG